MRRSSSCRIARCLQRSIYGQVSLRFAIMVLLLFPTGCGDDGSKGAPDRSATVISNATPVHEQQVPWVIGMVPRVIISEATSGTDAAFGAVAGTTQLNDGTIVVADQMSSRLLWFGRSGNLVRTAGRAGEGPGEFAQIVWLQKLAGDTLLVWDAQLSRLTRYTPEGDHIADVLFNERSWRGNVRGQGTWFRVPSLAGTLHDGTLFGYGTRTYPLESGIARDSVWFYFQSKGLSPAVSSPLGASETFNFDGARYAREYGERLRFAASSHGVYVTDGKKPLIRHINAAGTIDRTISARIPTRRVTSADKQRSITFVEEAVLPEFRVRALRAMSNMPFAEELTLFRSLIVDADGYLWAVRYTRPGEESAAEIFDENGKWLGGIRMPEDVQIVEIGMDYLLGLRSSEHGEVSVVEFPLTARRDR